MDYHQKQIKERASFLRTTQLHRMAILQNDGVYRHIQVKRHGCSAYHFNITTFPGYLVFTGDMGSYVFSRTRDMFEFMSINWDREVPTIDYRYWAQKCEAQDKDNGITEYDHDALEAAVKQNWRQHQKDSDDFLGMSSHHRRTVAQDFKWDVLDLLDSSDERGNFETIIGWEYHDADNFRQVQPFEEFWDYGSFEAHTFRFKWACWAIASTIRDYYLGGDRITRQEMHDKSVLSGVI